MPLSTLHYRTEKADFSVTAPLCVVDRFNQIILAAIVGPSTVVRGIVAALREKNSVVWVTGKPRNVASSRPFLVTYDWVQTPGWGDQKIALLISDISRVNVIPSDTEGPKDTRNHLAYAFGIRPEEIAWDLMSFLDIPLLPEWAGCFVQAMRDKGWLVPIQSVGLDGAWVFSATRSEYLTEVARLLGTDFRAPAQNRGWMVRPLNERITEALATPYMPIIRTSPEPLVSTAAARVLALANQMPEQLMRLHAEGKSDSPGPVRSLSNDIRRFTTFHQAAGASFVIQSENDGLRTTTEVKLVQEVEFTVPT